MLHTPNTWPLAVIATGGVIVAAISVEQLPGFPLGQWGVAGLSTGCALWGWWGVFTAWRHHKERGKGRWFDLTINELLAAAPRGKLYLGRGVALQRRHSQAIHDLTHVERDATFQDTASKGDTRLMGCMWRDIRPFRIAEDDANVHFLIYGATKRGKTRVAEIVALQAVLRERMPVIIIDPKGDPQFRRRMRAAATRAEVPFYSFDFSDPEHSATYNPIMGCTDPDQVGDQVVQLCTVGDGNASYWTGRAGNTARVVARAMEAMRLYLEACGGSGLTPPPELAALERTRGHQALPMEFAPYGWHLRLSVLDLYGVTAAHRLLGWMLRVTFADRLEKAPDAPEVADKALIATWWTAYSADREHPDDTHPIRGPLLAAIRVRMQTIRDLMSQEPEDLAKANSSLFEALERFRGRVSRLVDTPTPDIVWDRVIEQRAVVYFSLAAQEYADLAPGFARIMCADLSAWCGKRSKDSSEKASPFYLIADEVDRWIPMSFIDFMARGRSAGLRCVAIGQTRASFESRLGVKGREMVEGNAGTVFQFTAPGAEDAIAAAKRSGSSRIIDVQISATISDARAPMSKDGATLKGTDGHQISRSVQVRSQECDTFPSWAAQSLPTGTALVITQAGSALITFPRITDD